MKKVLSLVLVLTLVLGSFSFAFADNAQPTDNDRVNKLIELGLVFGDAGGYRLNDTITRAEAAAMVARALDLESVAQASKYQSSFNDVPAAHWALGYINVAAGRGIVKGYPDGSFRPDANISYAEIITMMVQVLGGLNEQEAKAPWPANYITKASQLGILKDVAIANYNEIAVRERVFEVVYNTITSQTAGNYQVVKAIVLENYRVESIDKGDVVVEVIREVQKGNFADESRKVKGDQIRVTLPASVGDVEDLLGKVVDLSFDKAGNVVKAEIDNSYTYEVGKIEAEEKSLTVAGSKYTVKLDERYKDDDERVFRTYYNNKSMKYVDFYQDPTSTTIKDSFEAEFARVTIKNGKVLFVDAFKFTDIAPVQSVKNDGKVVYVYNDEADGALKKLEFNSKTKVVVIKDKVMTVGSLEDIEANDVIHYVDNTVFVRTDAEVEGTYEKARSSTIAGVKSVDLYVDGEAYTALTETQNRKAVYTYNLEDFLTLKGTVTDIDERLSSYKGKDVVLLLDMNSKVQYVAGEVKDSHFLAMIENILGTEVNLIKADGEEETYNVRMKSLLVSYDDKSLKEARLEGFDPGDLVRVQLDEDGYIKRLIKLANNEIETTTTSTTGDANNWKYAEYSGLADREKTGQEVVNDALAYNVGKGALNTNIFVTKNTVIFVNNDKQLLATTMADILKNYDLVDKDNKPVDGVEGYVVYDEVIAGKENIAKVVVFTKLVKTTATTEDIVRKFIKHEYDGANFFILEDTAGVQKTHKLAATSVKGTHAAGDIVKLTVTKDDAQTVTKAVYIIDADKYNVYEVAKKADRRITLKDSAGVERWFYLSTKVNAFGDIEVGENVQIDLTDLTEGGVITNIVNTAADLAGTFAGGYLRAGSVPPTTPELPKDTLAAVWKLVKTEDIMIRVNKVDYRYGGSQDQTELEGYVDKVVKLTKVTVGGEVIVTKVELVTP